MFVKTYEPDNTDHEALLRELFDGCISEDAKTAALENELKTEEWTSLGF